MEQWDRTESPEVSLHTEPDNSRQRCPNLAGCVAGLFNVCRESRQEMEMERFYDGPQLMIDQRANARSELGTPMEIHLRKGNGISQMLG